MKRNTIQTVIIIIFLQLFYACALEQASPSDYNDAFYREQMKIKDLIDDLAKTNDPARQQQIVEALKEQTDESYQKTLEVGAFRGDDMLFEPAKDLFAFYKRMAHEGLDSQPDEISSNLEKWRKIMADEEHEFFRAQADFAEKYELFL